MVNNSQAKPLFKYIDFDLPFVLFLKDSLADPVLEKWADAYIAGEQQLPYSRYAPPRENPGGIIIGGGFPVYLPSKELAPYYVIALPDIFVGLRTLKRVNPNRSSILMGEVPGDRTGRASFSSIRIMIGLSQIQEEYRWDMALFCTLAIRAINHFIDHYRIIADRPYIEPVTLSVIQEFHLITEFEDGQLQHQEFGTGSGPLYGFGGAIADEVDNRLRTLISKPDPPNIYSTLDANIKNYLDIGDWRLAVIEAAVMFEAWLTEYLREKFKNKGIPEIEIASKFVKRDGLYKSVTELARDLVLEVTGFNFSATTEFLEWSTKVRDLRNDLVHGKRFDVTSQDAKGAYNAVLNAIKALISK